MVHANRDRIFPIPVNFAGQGGNFLIAAKRGPVEFCALQLQPLDALREATR